MDCSPPGSSVHGILQARILEWVAFPFSRGSSQPRDGTRSPALQADSLPAEPQGKLKNTEVGSLSLLQQIFPTHESNRGLLHCRQILYQLSHKESWRIRKWVAYPFSNGSSYPWIKPRSPALQANSLPTGLWGKPAALASGFFN